MKLSSCLALVGFVLVTSLESASGAIIQFNFPISAAQETNGSNSAGTGTGLLTYNTLTNELNAQISWSGLIGAGEVIKVHFHKGRAGENGPHQLDIVPPVAGPPFITSPAIGGPFILTNEQEADLLAGRWYVNIHTNTFPTGEIRGQAFIQQVYFFEFPISALQETNGSTSQGIGHGSVRLDVANNILNVVIDWTNLDPPGEVTRVHFHRGRCGESGPFQADVVPPAANIPSPAVGTILLTPNQVADILNGLWYVNVHTTAWTGGEIRGQVMNVFPAGDQIAKLTASDGATVDTFGRSVGMTDHLAVVGAPFDDDGGFDAGSVYVYQRDNLNWLQMPKVFAFDRAAGDNFGASVSISGETIIVGSPYDDDGGANTGSAYVYIRNNNGTPGNPFDDTWVLQQKLNASDRLAGDNFGWSVFMNGDDAIVGSINHDDGGSNTGSAYVFHRTAGVWTQQAKLNPSTPMPNGRFGFSVTIEGDTALVGAQQPFPTAKGAAFVFFRTAGVWAQQASLIGTDSAAGDRFGSSVALNGDIAFVGAAYDSDAGAQSGSAYVFKRLGATWMQLDKLVAHDAKTGDNFGTSVSVNGDNVLVGSRRAKSGALANAGAAYIFTRNVSCWVETAKLVASDAANDDEFGASVGLSKVFAIVGAPTDDDLGLNSGSAYVYLTPSTSDCNGNQVPDALDILQGTSEDCNQNGAPDECESACVTCPDSCFSACGVIVPNPQNDPDCPLLFQPDYGGGLLKIDRLGAFVPGNRVRVEGCLDTTCMVDCPQAVGCVRCNSIDWCDPCGPVCPGGCVEQCGELVQVGGCILWRSDTGIDFTLDNLGNFFVGDHVKVRGCIGPGAQPCGAPPAPCIVNNSIESCSAGCGTVCPASQQCFDGCGTLVPGQSCLVFQADAGGRFILSNLGLGFVPGSRISVKGCIDTNCANFCNEPGAACLNNEFVSACDPCSTPACIGCIDECGELVSFVDPFNSECVLFRGDTGLQFYVQNFGDFLPGDHVRIRGCLGGACPIQGCGPFPCITNNTVEACSAGCGTRCPFTQECFDGCGILVPGQNCLVFLADAGGRYVLSDLGTGFVPGARLSVKGCVDRSCTNFCNEPNALCLYNESIGRCDPCADPACFNCIDECGELFLFTSQQPPFEACVLFRGDTGLEFYLTNLGDFGPGDHVRVRGCSVGGCSVQACGPLICLSNNTIEACSAGCATQCPPGQNCVDSCGTIVPGNNCLVFLSDSGGRFVLGNNGNSFQPGLRISVKGCIDPNCTNFCGEPDALCLYNETVELCDPCSSPGCFSCIDECGELVAFTNPNPPFNTCTLFRGDTGFDFYLENLGDFVVGDHVQVRGCVGAGCAIQACGPFPCIADNTIEACSAGCATTCPPVEQCFDGCGIIIPGPVPPPGQPQCLLFQADSGGKFALSNRGVGFVPGLRVTVKGCVELNCANLCGDPDVLCLYNESVEPCDPCQSPACVGSCFDECGVLTSFTSQQPPFNTCLIFRSGLGLEFYVENLGDFAPGDLVRVRGCAGGGCPIQSCGPFACISNNSIEACLPDCSINVCPPVETCFAGCGTIVPGQQCMVFETDTGDRYLLSDYGNFTVGAKVEVSGCVDPNFVNFCGEPNALHLFNDHIRSCPCAPCPTTCFEGCGMVFLGDSCLLFAPEAGGLYQLGGNLAGIQIGYSYYVTGCIDDTCTPTCQIPVIGCLNADVPPVRCRPTCPFSQCLPQDCRRTCGQLVQGVDCILFREFFPPNNFGALFSLDNLGTFLPGDFVFVTGCVDPNIDLGCSQNQGLAVNRIQCNTIDGPACRRTCQCQPGETCFVGCGTISIGPGPQNCVLFAADAGGTFSLVGNLAGFSPGNKVFITGCISTANLPNCGTPLVGQITFDAPATLCAAAPIPLCPTFEGDMNGDSVIDGADIQPFIDCLLGGSGSTGNCGCAPSGPTSAGESVADSLTGFVQLLLDSGN